MVLLRGREEERTLPSPPPLSLLTKEEEENKKTEKARDGVMERQGGRTRGVQMEKGTKDERK